MERVLRLARSVRLAVCAIAFIASSGFESMTGQATAENNSVKQLRDLGKRLAAAVLSHDVETILAYDRPDLRAEDRLAFQDSKSDTYCFIFDSSCTTIPSVYEILSRARRLDIEVQVLRGKSNSRYGWLLFFDGTKIRRSQLRSPSFLCQHSREIASWMFKRENNEWLSAHPPFDGETDTLCSPR
jgi:hypothetical protein